MPGSRRISTRAGGGSAEPQPLRRSLWLCALYSATIRPRFKPLGWQQRSNGDPNGTRRRIDIGGRQLYFEVAGEGIPTVVFESGIECGAASLANLADAVQGFTRALIYDRAGIGQSDPAPVPRTAQDMANDLWDLLTQAQVPGPYLLVGHSYGGLPLRLFATQHRNEVAGMVLLDASYPDLARRQLALLSPPAPGEPPALTRMRAELEAEQIDPFYNSEGIDLTASGAQVLASGRLGALPLVVMTAGLDEWEEGFAPELAQAQEEDWLAMQKEWAALSDNSTHIIATESDHVIQECQPELVVGVIRRLVEALRAGGVAQIGSWVWTSRGSRTSCRGSLCLPDAHVLRGLGAVVHPVGCEGALELPVPFDPSRHVAQHVKLIVAGYRDLAAVVLVRFHVDYGVAAGAGGHLNLQACIGMIHRSYPFQTTAL